MKTAFKLLNFRSAIALCAIGLTLSSSSSGLTLSAWAGKDGTTNLSEANEAAKKKAKKAQTGAITGMGIWTAALAVCVYYCVLASVADQNGTVCSYADIGAGLADAAAAYLIQKEASAAISGAVGAGATYLLMPGAAPAGQPANTVTAGNTAGCTMGIGMAGLQIALKAYLLSQAKKAEKAASNSQAELESDIKPLDLALGGDRPGGNESARGGRPLLATVGGAEDFKGSPGCKKELNESLKTYSECAIAADSSLRKVLTPNLADEFKKITGKDLQSYLKSVPDSATPAQRMNAALAGLGALKDPSKIDQFDAFAQRKFAMLTSGGLPQGGGGGGKKESEFDLAKQLQGVLGAGADGEGDAGGGSSDFASFGSGRATASGTEAERRDLSIFERVSSRYQIAGKFILFKDGKQQ